MNWFPPVKYIPTALISIGLSVNVLASDLPVPSANTVLTIDSFVGQVLKNNAQIIYADIQRDIAKEKISFEQGAYETELFSNLAYDDANLQRSAGDKFASSFSSQNKQDLTESNTSLTLGVRRIVGSGGEVTLSYLAQEKNNNIIPSSIDPTERDSEFTTAVNLEFMQPLLKGFGNVATETRIKRAQIEDKIVDVQYRHQMLKVVFEATSSYWQVYKITRFIAVREAALVNAKNTLKDVERKANMGKKSQHSILDAKSEVLKRKIAYDSARQARNEAIYKISTLININPDNFDGLVFELVSEPDTSPFALTLPFDDYFNKVLVDWPNYQVLDFNIAMQEQEIALVNDELKPKLDLKLGYKTNMLESEFNGFDSINSDHPSWYVGLNFSMPIGGNQRINAKKSMAMLKKSQQKEDLNAVKVGLKNDLRAKLFQVKTTYQEMVSLTENVVLLEELFMAEKKKFNLGYGELTDVYEREDDLNIEKQRLIDGQVKYELAKVSLSLADGTLLKAYIVAN
jgi:outer membrane protein TolC